MTTIELPEVLWCIRILPEYAADWRTPVSFTATLRFCERVVYTEVYSKDSIPSKFKQAFESDYDMREEIISEDFATRCAKRFEMLFNGRLV